MSSYIHAELEALSPVVQSTLTFTFAYKLVSEKIEKRESPGTLMTVVSLVIQLFLTIIFKSFVDKSRQILEDRAEKYPHTPTLSEVMIVPFKLTSYILDQAKMIFVQSFSVLMAYEISEIQPTGDSLPLVIQVVFITGVMAYYYTLLYAIKFEPT